MTPQETDCLQDVLVLAVRKGFWASRECEVFPNRIYTRRIFSGPGRWGSSRNPANVLTAALEGYLYFLVHKPKLLFLWAPRVAGWFALLKGKGLLPGVKLVAPGALYLDDAHSQHLDKLIVFSRCEIATHDGALQDKYAFIPLPGPDKVSFSQALVKGDYVFAGGGAGRDFASLIEAVRGLDVQLRIVTFSKKTLDYDGELPKNCQVLWRMPHPEFLKLMAGALFVVAPLKGGLYPHGHTTVVEALCMGKAIVTTQGASVGDYVAHGQEGFLVLAGDVCGYRQAILRLLEEPGVRESCEWYARLKAQELTYEAFSKRLAQLCYELLRS